MPRKSKPSQETEPFAGLTLADLDKVAPGPVAQSHVGQAVSELELQADLKLTQAQRDASNRRIEELTDELAERDKRIEDLEARWNAAGRSIDQMIEQVANQAHVIKAQRAELEAMIEQHIGLQAEKEKGEIALALGDWLSAALEDEAVCPEFKRDISAWFDAGMPYPTEAALASIGPQAAPQEREKAQKDGTETPGSLQEAQNAPLPYPDYLAAAQDLRARTGRDPMAVQLLPSQDAQNARNVALRSLLDALPTQDAQDVPEPVSSKLQVSQDAQNAALPASDELPPHSNDAEGGKTRCTGSDAAMLAVTVTSLEAELKVLQHENLRLIRRIEEMGGKPPKRDRAAYMRSYRNRNKMAVCKEKLVRFLAGDE